MKSELPTNKELADALGVSVRRVGQLKAEQMPCDSIAAAVAWREQQQHGDNSTEQLRSQRIRLVAAQATRHETENLVRRGDLLEKGDVQRDVVKVSTLARDRFLRMSHDLPPRLEGLPANKLAKVLHDEIVATLEALCRDFTRLYSAAQADQ